MKTTNINVCNKVHQDLFFERKYGSRTESVKKLQYVMRNGNGKLFDSLKGAKYKTSSVPVELQKSCKRHSVGAARFYQLLQLI